MVSGFNAAGAWKITRGDPSVAVAILDTGINWDNGGLRDKIAPERGRAAAAADAAGRRRPRTATT